MAEILAERPEFIGCDSGIDVDAVDPHDRQFVDDTAIDPAGLLLRLPVNVDDSTEYIDLYAGAVTDEFLCLSVRLLDMCVN
jgi:hypothetical protein